MPTRCGTRCWRIGRAESEDGRSRRDPSANEGRDPGGAVSEPLAGQSRPGGTQPAERVLADEAVVDTADAADFRRARFGDELPPAGNGRRWRRRRSH